jgi:hypothetical protein
MSMRNVACGSVCLSVTMRWDGALLHVGSACVAEQDTRGSRVAVHAISCLSVAF